jgi:hypothetical protein
LKPATFLQVGDSAGQEDTEQPCQESFPDLKLVTQPPTQLPVMLASFASFSESEVDAAKMV